MIYSITHYLSTPREFSTNAIPRYLYTLFANKTVVYKILKYNTSRDILAYRVESPIFDKSFTLVQGS